MVEFRNFNPNISGANQELQGMQYGIDQDRRIGKFKLPDGKTYTIEILNISQEQAGQLNETDWETIAFKVALILHNKHLLNERQITLKKDRVELNENITITHADRGNQMLDTSQHANTLFQHLSTKFRSVQPQILNNLENIVNIPPVENNIDIINEENADNKNEIINTEQDKKQNESIEVNILFEDDNKITNNIEENEINVNFEDEYVFINKDDDIQEMIHPKEKKTLDLPVLDPKTQRFDLGSVLEELKQYEGGLLIVQFTSTDPNKIPKKFTIDPKKLDFSTTNTLLQKQWKSLIKEGYVNMDMCGITQTSQGTPVQISNILSLKYDKKTDSVAMTEEPLLIPIGQSHIVKKHINENSITSKNKSSNIFQTISNEKTELLQRKKEDDIKKFTEEFCNVLESSYPNLVLEEEKVSKKIKELCKLNCQFQDYSDELISNQQLASYLAEIAEKLPAETEQSKLVKEFVFDAVLTTFLIPEREERFEISQIKYHSLQTFSPDSLIAILQKINQNLLEKKPISLGLLLSIDPNSKMAQVKYSELSAMQKTLILSTSHLNDTLKTKLFNDPLFQKIWDSPFLEDWLFASSGSLPQDFLNGCSAASIAQDILSKTPTIIGLLLINEFLHDEMQKQIDTSDTDVKSKTAFNYWFKQGPTVEDHMKNILSQVKKESETLRKQTEDLLDQERAQSTPTSSQKHQKLIDEWSTSFQKLSSILNPEDVSLLASQPVKGSWATSFVLKFLSGIFSILVPGSIKSTEYLNSPDRDEIIQKLSLVFTNYNLSKRYYKSMYTTWQSSTNKQAYLNKLWNKMNNKGGSLVSMHFHATYLKAIKRKGERVFLIGDPVRGGYKSYTFKQFEKFLARGDVYRFIAGNIM